MNILLLTHSYPDKNNSWRGSFIKDQASALSSVHNVIVVYFRVDYQRFLPFSKYSSTKTINGNLTEYELVINRSFPVINQASYLFKSYRFITREILPHFKPDIVHSHRSYPAGFLGTIIQMNRGIPVILTEHSKITSYFRSWFHKRCVMYTLKKASEIIAVSNSLRNEIFTIANRQVNVIYNFVDSERFNLQNTTRGTSLNIGFLGGLGDNNKGLDIMLKAATLLQDKNFFIHIGGKGILLEDYRKMALDNGLASNCKFYGDIPRNEISDFYSKLDLFVSASRNETFGIVLIEAMSCGLPVIATKCGGPQEIVTEESGILIEKENAPALAGAIDNMSKNISDYNPNTIRTSTEKRFGVKTFIEKINMLYLDVLSGSK
jgi:L-malate glycosyltransferase